jgi:hypothetical protein
MEIKDSEENLRNSFFSKVYEQAYDLVSENDRNGKIRILNSEIIAMGYTKRNMFEEELLSKVFARLSNTINRDTEDIKDFFKDKFEYRI